MMLNIKRYLRRHLRPLCILCGISHCIFDDIHDGIYGGIYYGSAVTSLSRLLRRGLGANGPEQAVEAVLRLPLPVCGGFQARFGLGGVQLSPVLPGQIPHPASGGGCSGRGTRRPFFSGIVSLYSFHCWPSFSLGIAVCVCF